jgi:hypothetical protein
MRYVYLVFIFSALSINCKSEERSIGSVGAGYGVTYGMLGVKVDYAITDSAYVALGLGLQSAVGIQFFLREPSEFWRPKISLYYGSVGYSNLQRNNEEIGKSFYGASLEVGQVLQFGPDGRHGLDISLILPLTDGGEDKWEREKEAEGYSNCCGADISEAFIYINVGYQYKF